ncbi:MAG: hypothetical protein JWM81_394 [Candidatus Saccharibacteria bacterium]|nr:hypothetical protein [Candidatus Saccharibacteria bacterium]
MAATSKDTIYIDIDEEITGIIDKVRASDGKVVALVLPKRASVLQSIVNMKLLKRSADESKKNLVLITSEAGLLPLAGAVGLHVAKTPQSKPEIPMAPQTDFDREETIDEDEPVQLSDADAAVAPVAAAALAAAPVSADDVETVQLDDDAPVAAAVPSKGDAKKPKKNKKLAIPNFERFRLLLILGAVVLILLIGGAVLAFNVLPKAQISVTTNATSLNVRSNVTLSTAATTVSASDGLVPAKVVSQQKTATQAAPATGQKNNGLKASGSVTIALTGCNKDTVTIPSGSGVSSNGQTYITQSAVTLTSVKVGNKCNPSQFSNIYSQDTKIVAIKAGTDSNLAAGASFTVVSGTDYNSSDVKATADNPVDGGTDDITKVVTQSDIDSAKQKLTATDSSIKQQLLRQLQDQGLYAVTDTFLAGTPAITSSVEAGTTADTVTVTQTVTYTMFGAKESDINAVIDNAAKSQIDSSKQNILSRGLDNAQFTVIDNAADKADLGLQTVVTAGPDLTVDQLKQQVAGKKGGEVKSLLESNPGVTDVQVKLSPFFVTSVPKKASKISITIADPTPAATKSNATSNP